MALSSIEIPITDHFDDGQGRFLNYEAYDATQRAAVRTQRHKDIRCFIEETVGTSLSMATLDTHDMSWFTGLAMSGISNTTVIHSEQWDGGTLGPQADRNYWNGISITVPAGSITVTSYGPTVDLSAFAPTDTLSLALPNIPSQLTQGSSFVDFTSHPDGNFAAGPTATLSLAGIGTGDKELSAALSVLAPLNYVVTAVRFRLTASATCTFRCLAIRALASTWTYAPLDVNTLTGRVVRPVSRNGAAAALVGFPTNSFADPQVPNDWPILLRADEPSGTTDPRPIDLSEVALFHTGARTSGDIRLYFREYPYDLVTQLELDTVAPTQQDLDGAGKALDFDTALYRARDQDDLNALPQSNLDSRPQYDLETEPDYFTKAWIEVKLTWGSGTQSVTIRDTENNVYTFTGFTLTANTRYALFVTLEDDAIRVRIYPVSSLDVVDYGTVVFDSTLIRNSFVFRRRSGRVGWYASFADGNSYLDSIRAYDANFAEYRSVPLRSLSPVCGGQLFYGGSGFREFFTGPESVGSATVTPDYAKSSSGACYRVNLDGTMPNSGVTTNLAAIDNFGEALLSFDLFYPSEAYDKGGRLDVLLTDLYGRSYALNPGMLFPDRWHTYRVSFGRFKDKLLPGRYAVRFLLSSVNVKTTYWIDNISIRQPMLAWMARAEVGDPWNDDARKWIEFREAINGQTNGILFPTNGNSPQVRALARCQNAHLSTVKFIPKVAPLGRLVWSDQKVATQDPVIGAFTTGDAGFHTATFTPGSVTLKPGNRVVYYEWSFGDGSGVATGKDASHVYASAGTYVASLTVVDDQGRRATRFQNVTVA